MKYTEYMSKVEEALMAFQFLEVSLKFYIRDCEKLIQKSVKDSFHYSVSEKEIEKMPMGKLIIEFKKRSNRNDLIAGLNKLPKLRNQVAHSAYVLTVEEQNDEEELKSRCEKLSSVIGATKECMKAVLTENARITKKPITEGLLNQL